MTTKNKYTKIQHVQGLRLQRNYIIARYRKSDLHGASSQIIAENKSHAHHETRLHTVKVYNTRPSQFC